MCCSLGKVSLNALPDPPKPLKRLLSSPEADAAHFRNHIRLYNSCFQMTSFGVKNRVFERGFMPTFKIQGQVYHSIGSLREIPWQLPAFLQIYFIENGTQQAQRRMEFFPTERQHIRNSLLLQLQNMLHIFNPQVANFKTARERSVLDENYRIVIRADKTPIGEHRRRYNAPTASEVAGLIVNEDAGQRDVVLHSRSNSLQRVCQTHMYCDSWQYPLLFPRGEEGYHLTMWLINPATSEERPEHKISPRQYYAYRIMQRSGKIHTLLRGKELSHHYHTGI